MNAKSVTSLVATDEGIVHFGYYPDAALNEVAKRYAMHGLDRTIIVHWMRTRLLQADGVALAELLRDLHDAAVRHGADDAVELTKME